MRPHDMKKILTALALVATLSGCGGNADEDKILPGERLSVLAYQKELEPDSVLSVSQMTLPEVWNNQFWPQAGGYPSHAMGHLALAPRLKKAWDSSIGEGGTRDTPLLSPPVVADGVIYTLDTKSQLTAFETVNGRKKWRLSLVPPKEKKQPMPGGGIAHAGGRLFVATSYGQVVALSAEDGKIIWRRTLTAVAHAAPTVAGDRVLLMTIDNKLFCFDAASGEPVWNYAGVAETTNLLGGASPAIDQSVVVAAFSSGEMSAFRIENGSNIWTDNLSAVKLAGAVNSIADIRGLPVIDRGMVFAISYNGRMAALDLLTGERLWQREIAGAETPYAAGDTLFAVTANQQLVALSRETGGIRWIFTLPQFEDPKERKNPIVWTGPVLAGNRLIVAGSKGRVIDINPLDGTKQNEWKAEGAITLPPLVADGTLYLLTEGGKLTAYR